MPIPNSQVFGKEQSPRGAANYRIEVTRTTQIAARKIYLQWIIRDGAAASGYTFSVYRAASPTGPWELLRNDLQDEYFYVDDQFPGPISMEEPGLFALRDALYYRVVVTHPTVGISETIKEVEGALDRRRRAMAKKLRRDAELKIRKGTGTEVAILKRRWWGEPCDCISSTGHVMRAHCTECQGTGIKVGYWNPVYTFGKRSADPMMSQTTTAGAVEVKNILVTIPYIPRVDSLDVLVFLRDNRRYIINNVAPTELHTVTIHQELSVSELAKSAREYKIPADNWHIPRWF